MLLSLLIVAVYLLLFTKSPEKCLALVLIWYPTILLFPICRGIQVSTLLIYILLFYALVYQSNYKAKYFPLLLPFCICVFSYLISSLFGLKISFGIFRMIEQYVLAFVIWLLYKPTSENNRFLFCHFIIYLVILNIYAIFEAFSFMNPVLDYLRSGGGNYPEQGETYVRYGIYRAQSMTIWTSILGMTSAVGAFFLHFSYFKGYVKGNLFLWICVGLCLIGIFISGTRTVIVFFIFASFSFFSYFRRMKVLFLILLCLAPLLFFIGDYLALVMDSFLNPEDTGGSSVEMRGLQFLVAFNYWMNSPIVGNGLGYTDFLVDQKVGLLGAESIVFQLLIDRGILGAFSFVFLYGYAILILYRMEMFKVSFFILAFAFGKISSLIPSLTEAYIFSYVILIIKFNQSIKFEFVKKVLLRRYFNF